jgi:lipopolysaccharide/colanic/teichoic acid biosynthesis glycosyltransferase
VRASTGGLVNQQTALSFSCCEDASCQNACAACDRSGIEPFFGGVIPLWKRFFDILSASFLLILLLPLFISIALLIKIVSPGPVIYRQERIGLRGRRFEFLKFRTMKVAANDSRHRQYLKNLIVGSENQQGKASPMKKLDSIDPNIIRFGGFLRSSCLDELPQLINVLRGEMSLVGPRPPIPYEVYDYKQWHCARFNCLPGMTGLWQVSGKNRLSFPEMVRLDIRYARNMSLWQDIKILLSTPYAVWREVVGQVTPLEVTTLANERE